MLRAVSAAHLERAREEDAPTAPARRRSDGTAIFALLMTLPWLLPQLGVRLGDIAFAMPLMVLVFAAARAAARARADERWASMWWSGAISAAAAAAASVLAIVSAVADGRVDHMIFYVGALGSAGLLAMGVFLARGSRAGVRWERLVDAGLLGLVLASAGTYLLVVPGLMRGDVALTGVVIADLAAMLLVAFAAVARRARRDTPGAWWLAGACGGAVLGDGLVSASAAGQIGSHPTLTAILWALAAYALAVAARENLPAPTPEDAHEPTGRRWIVGRVVLPLVAVLSFPGAAAALAIAHALPAWGLAYFSAFFVVALAAVFGRQAYLLADHERAMRRERTLRREATRRSEELEALTGLATTMTQSLEEDPIIEQALGVLSTAARASSIALHLDNREGHRLAATAGDWHLEREWANRLPASGMATDVRGGRALLRLPLAARGTALGSVTLMRPAAQPFEERGISLLRLLTDQLAVAVQNARDYHERLDQAVRDPLTGVYNRRFLLEALGKEVSRLERYGGEATLVIFDVDDFKLINDRHGHGEGDEVLRALARTANALIRPADSLARIGGEEFALLLPETSQLEGLLVAERLRAAIGRDELLARHHVTVSAGIASCPVDATVAEELQRRADMALYWAKRHGKDLCAVAGEAREGTTDPEGDALVSHLYGLVAMVDRGHGEAVAACAVALGEALGFDRERLVKMRRAAMLHDVGKVTVPAEVLGKPAALTEHEYARVREHAVVGAMMLAHAGLQEEATWVRHHHERADGGGYPDGLPLDEIPLESRVLAAADAFQAMLAERPYRAAMSLDDAVAEIRRCAGTQFDHQVAELLVELAESGRLPAATRV